MSIKYLKSRREGVGIRRKLEVSIFYTFLGCEDANGRDQCPRHTSNEACASFREVVISYLALKFQRNGCGNRLSRINPLTVYIVPEVQVTSILNPYFNFIIKFSPFFAS